MGMTLSNPLYLSKEERLHLTEIIQRSFRTKEEIVSFHQPENGMNRNTHRVVITDQNNLYGIKFAKRVEQGTEKEKVVGDCATLLELPNATPIVIIEAGINIEPFLGLTVNITKWLKNSLTLERTLQSEIRKKSDIFFLQFGEWMLFSLYFGIKDRARLDNWVWNNQDSLLCMIDMEESFSQTVTYRHFRPFFENYSDIDLFKTKKKEATNSVCFIKALENLYIKFQRKKEEIREILSSGGFGEYIFPWQGATFKQIEDEIYTMFTI